MKEAKKKELTRQELLTWLKAQADDAFEGFLEDMNSHIGCEEWEIVNDDTPQETLGTLLNHESPVVQILVKHRLAGHSISGNEVFDDLFHLLEKDGETNDKYNMDYKQGRFYTIAKLYEELGEEKLAGIWKMWAWFAPYD